MKYLAIALGGALGSVARYWVGSMVGARFGSRFPYGTLVINITACAIIGFSLTIMARFTQMDQLWRYLIPIGFVGAYSTFSTFEWEIFSNLEAGAFAVSCLYLTVSIASGLAAVWCGARLGRVLS